MKKILLTTAAAVLVSACSGGGGSESITDTQVQLTRSDLEISDKSLGSMRQDRSGSLTKGETSSSDRYDPNYQVDAATSRIAGNSTLKFRSDGRITLNWELCRTNENDCGGLREAVMQDKTVKYKGVGRSSYQDIDAKQLYDRSIVTVSDNQKVSQANAAAAFGNDLANTFNFHWISSLSLAGGDRSSLDGASWINVVDDRRDSLHDPNALNYWDKDGVKEWNTGGKAQIILATVTSKQNTFARHARLGIFDVFVRYGSGLMTGLTFANVDGTYTTAANLSNVGAKYEKAGGWHTLGYIDDKFVYMRGNVKMEFNPGTRKLTKFDVDNMTYQQIQSNREGKTGGSTAFLSGKKLQLAAGSDISYGNDGDYTGALTEDGTNTGRAGKWDARFEGNFFGANAEETAGTVAMHKNNSSKIDVMVGGYAADKQP